MESSSDYEQIEQPPEVIEINVRDGIPVSERFLGHGQGESTEGIRVSESTGQSAWADVLPDGSIKLGIQGKSRQGEEGSKGACRILIERLNDDGAHWGELIDVTDRQDDIDYEAHAADRVLRIQVTRGLFDQGFWRVLGRFGQVTDTSTVDNAVEVLREAIEAKAKLLSSSQRAEITLALDGTETAHQVFRRTIDSFRRRHGFSTGQLGFKEIWIIGPTSSLTFRLDAPPFEGHPCD